jgi:hypothetical protein
MRLKPTKVSKEDLELADEISRVTTIKELVADFILCLDKSFGELQDGAEKDNPVIVYKNIVAARQELIGSAQLLQAQLLTTLGELDGEDALGLSNPEVAQTAGTMDAALESTDQVVEIHVEES